MDPNVWGPPLWFIMHTVALNYPETSPSYIEQRNHHDFYSSLRNILPCVVCREHYTELLKLYPITPSLESRDRLVEWVGLIHNKVNARYGRPDVTIDSMARRYEEIYNRGSYCDPAAQPSSDDLDTSATTSEEGESVSDAGGNGKAKPRKVSARAEGDKEPEKRHTMLIVMCSILILALIGCGIGMAWKRRTAA